MKLFSKRSLAVLAVSALTLLGGLGLNSFANAIGEGQIEGGDIYRIKNVTKNSEFKSTQTADKCETVQYKVRLHNPGVSPVTNVTVKATLPSGASTSHTSTVTTTSQNAQPAVTTANAVLNLTSSQSLSYIAGSTELLDTYSKLIKTLPDGIIGSGVNIGTVGVSIYEIKFVTFKVKIDCEKPQVPKYTCDSLKATTLNGRTVRFVATASVSGGATISNYTFNYGDGASETVNNSTVEHTYANAGTYNASVVVNVMANGQAVTASGEACKVKVKFDEPKKPNFELEKGVRQAGSNSDFKNDIKVEYGSEVEYRIVVKNTGETELKNVNVKDVLPAGVTYNSGSLKLNGQANNGDLFGSGVVIPSIAIDGSATITYTAKVKKLDGVNCDLKNYRNVVTAKPEGLDKKEDDANVKADCEEIKPEYICDSLTLVKTGGRSVKLTAKASASGGAVVKRYIFNFGDGGEQTTDKNEVTHTYAKDGKYVVTVNVQFGIGNEVKTVTGENCSAQVEFVTPTTPEKPTTPGKLPETGAGSAVAIFMAVATASSAAYYAIAGRRS